MMLCVGRRVGSTLIHRAGQPAGLRPSTGRVNQLVYEHPQGGTNSWYTTAHRAGQPADIRPPPPTGQDKQLVYDHPQGLSTSGSNLYVHQHGESISGSTPNQMVVNQRVYAYTQDGPTCGSTARPQDGSTGSKPTHRANQPADLRPTTERINQRVYAKP